MARLTFQHRPTKTLFKHLETTAQRSRVSRHTAFEDTLTLIRCTLARPFMEAEYLETVERHKEGKEGARGIDSVVEFFAEMVGSDDDLLGDLFQSAITSGEGGQFLTPDSICQLTAAMSLPAEPTGIEGRKSVCDPCCGSGRMLLAAARVQPHWQFVGRDLDFRCVQMTAINLALRNLYGHVIWGDSLADERRRVFETGRVQIYGNVIREVHLAEVPSAVRQLAAQPAAEPGTQQMTLFD